MSERILHSGSNQARVRLTPWDERAFGFRTAEILKIEGTDHLDPLIAMVDEWMTGEGVRYSFGRIGADAATQRQSLQEAGYQFIETSLMVGRPRTEQWPRVPGSLQLHSSLAQSSHLDDLARIGVEDFAHGRFLEDPTLDSDLAHLRTANWISDLARNRQLHGISLNDTLVGFCADSIDAETHTANLILYGVSSRYPMLALPLWINALQRLNQQGAKRYQAMLSAANVPVINLYLKLGFQVVSTHFGFRKWHPNPHE
ncbi:hypothetical protein [Pseudoxanthomonas sp. 10H]|uniref:hypothetical protein n=1 Tax=Pseudoxanthomonas sp. 10H TaxID=3242729 RepID=UPI003558AFFE